MSTIGCPSCYRYRTLTQQVNICAREPYHTGPARASVGARQEPCHTAHKRSNCVQDTYTRIIQIPPAIIPKVVQPIQLPPAHTCMYVQEELCRADISHPANLQTSCKHCMYPYFSRHVLVRCSRHVQGGLIISVFDIENRYQKSISKTDIKNR